MLHVSVAFIANPCFLGLWLSRGRCKPAAAVSGSLNPLILPGTASIKLGEKAQHFQFPPVSWAIWRQVKSQNQLGIPARYWPRSWTF